jgi:hypothetical protein
MISVEHPVTPLHNFKPRRPIVCSLCGTRLGAWWQYKTTYYPHYERCSERCEALLAFANRRQHVPRSWRDYPDEWRAPLLAAALVEKEASHEV